MYVICAFAGVPTIPHSHGRRDPTTSIPSIGGLSLDNTPTSSNHDNPQSLKECGWYWGDITRYVRPSTASSSHLLGIYLGLNGTKSHLFCGPDRSAMAHGCIGLNIWVLLSGSYGRGCPAVWVIWAVDISANMDCTWVLLAVILRTL